MIISAYFDSDREDGGRIHATINDPISFYLDGDTLVIDAVNILYHRTFPNARTAMAAYALIQHADLSGAESFELDEGAIG